MWTYDTTTKDKIPVNQYWPPEIAKDAKEIAKSCGLDRTKMTLMLWEELIFELRTMPPFKELPIRQKVKLIARKVVGSNYYRSKYPAWKNN